MTKKELDAREERLVEQQQKFVEGVRLMCDVVEGLKQYIKAFGSTMESHQAVMESCGEEFKAALAGFEAVTKAFSDGYAALGENTQKLDKFIGKMESYFGSGTGLEYDN